MRHSLGIQSYFYDCVKKGTKKIELRLLDEKRKTFKVGDELEIFRDPGRKESFVVKISGLLVYNTFEDILNDYPISYFGDENTNKEELLGELLKYYPIEEQKALNVVGIRIELIDKSKIEQKAKVVTVCGSMKFKDEMLKQGLKLELENSIVLMPILLPQGVEIDDSQAQILGEKHYEKIAMSDAIFVVNVDGYIGNSVKKEIEYAQKLGKEIIYLEEEK